MLAQRTAHQALRKFAFQQQGAFSPLALSRSVAPSIPLAIFNNNHQRRLAATQPISQSEGYNILTKQRLNRPVSPHLGIYKPQITWTLSSLTRITGSMLSGGFYIFGFGYLIQPYIGVHLFESSSLVAGAAALPALVKVPIKFLAAWFFTFHSFNGIRHFAWDTGRQFKNQQVIRTGWFVVGLSVITAGALTFW